MSTLNISTKERKLLVGTALSIPFLYLFTQFLLITAYPKIMDEFNINATQVQWLSTSFLISQMIIIPVMGYFINRFSVRSLTSASLIFFIIGTIIALVSQNFITLIIARVIQAIGAGIMLPLLQTILLLVYPISKRGFAMGLMTMVINFAPAISPPLAGIIIDVFNWRSLFILILPIAIVLYILNTLFMKNVTQRKASVLDIISLLLLTISFPSFLFGLTNISVYGLMDLKTFLPMIIGLLVLAVFIFRQLKLNNPVINMKLFKNKLFVYGTFLTFILSIVLLSTETLIPLFIQDVQNKSAFISGIILFPGTIIFALISYIAGNLYDKYKDKWINSIGFFILTLSFLCFTLSPKDSSSILLTALFCLFMIGIGLTITPSTTIAMESLKKDELADASAILNTLKQFGSAFGITILTTFVSINASNPSTSYAEGTLLGLNISFFIMFLLGVLAITLTVFRLSKR